MKYFLAFLACGAILFLNGLLGVAAEWQLGGLLVFFVLVATWRGITKSFGPIKYKCPSCGTLLKSKRSLVGLFEECSECGTLLMVPSRSYGAIQYKGEPKFDRSGGADPDGSADQDAGT